MSFLCRYGLITVNKNNSSPTPTLRKTLNPCNDLLPVKFLQLANCIKRISLLILPKIPVKASMTVETALVLPLFCFFMIHMGSAIEMMRLHGNLEVALWDAGRQVAIYGGVPETGKNGEDDNEDRLGTVAISYTYVKNQIRNQLGAEYLEQSPMEHGADGLQFLESRTENDICEIIVTYEICPMTEVLGFRKFRMANRYYGHLWNGYRIPGTEDGEEYVYITEDSEVYHVSRECTHLRLTVRRVEATELPGGYQPCEKCMGQKKEDSVPEEDGYYICDEGKCYHRRWDCPGLKRTVYCIPRKDADRYRECSRCGKTYNERTGEDEPIGKRHTDRISAMGQLV